MKVKTLSLPKHFNMNLFRTLLPHDKFQSLCSHVRAQRKSLVHICMWVLDLMVASFKAVLYAQFHSRPLQHSGCVEQTESLDRSIHMNSKANLSLMWWSSNPAVELGKPFYHSGGLFFQQMPACRTAGQS